MRRQLLQALALGAIVVPLALASGAYLREAREAPPAPETSRSESNVLSAPSPSPFISVLTAAVTQDQAIALVRGSSDHLRIDRIEAKLVPWTEFAPIGMGIDMTGGPQHGGEHADVVWAVAVSGDIYPSHWGRDDAPREHFTWALWGVDATPFARIVSLNVGKDGSWPPGFDALAGRAAIPPPPPTATPAPPRFDHIAFAPAKGPRFREMAMAADGALFGIAEELALLRSDDGGATWQPLSVPTRGAGPRHVAAVDGLVLVSDIGSDHDGAGRSTTGGLYLSSDRGATWERVLDDAIANLFVHRRADGSSLFLAERFYVKDGAATGPSVVVASLDGTHWREIGEVPGPAVFGAVDVPIVSFIKNDPRDGILRVEGSDLGSLRLVPMAGSGQAWLLQTEPGTGRLWSLFTSMTPRVRYSDDSGRTWIAADIGLDGRVAGIFFWGGRIWAIGDGAYAWDGTRWQTAMIVTGKASKVFQLGTTMFIQDIPGSLWRLD